MPEILPAGVRCFFFFFSSRRRHTRWPRDWSSDVCSSDLAFCGGDILSVDMVSELLARGCPVWNLYGPTETTIWSSVHQADANDDSDSWTLIGRPIANTQMYIMDANPEPAPVGTPGELMIGGDGVATGYWKR